MVFGRHVISKSHICHGTKIVPARIVVLDPVQNMQGLVKPSGPDIVHRRHQMLVLFGIRLTGAIPAIAAISIIS